MRADEAFAQSTRRLIVADTPRGLVTIFHQPRTEDSAEGFHLRFIPCDAHGHLNAAGTVTVGSYDDLDTALTIAAVSYGTGEAGWNLVKGELNARGAFGEHGPIIEGRRISHPGEDGDGDVESE